MSSPPRRPNRALDLAPILASAACLVHCLLMPLLLALLPAASRLFALPEDFHLFAFVFAVPASAVAMGAGYRHHGLAHPALFGGLGLVLLAAGMLAHERLLLETGLTVGGSLILATAHVLNWRLRLAAACR